MTPARRRPAQQQLLLLLLTAGVAMTACVNEREAGTVQPSIEEVLARHTPALMRIAGVEGTGQALCSDRPCIRVFIARAAVADSLPAELDGYAVDAVVTGPIRPLVR